MAKYSSAHVPYVLVDGLDVKGQTTEISDINVESIQEQTHTLGDSWEESTHVGLRKASWSQQGFYEDGAAFLDSLLATGTGTIRTVTIGLSPTKAIGMEGAFGGKYDRKIDRGKLHKFKVTWTVTGAVEELTGLSSPATSQTADWNDTSVDNGASSANGGTGYIQVTSFSGFSGFVGSISDSADNVSFSPIIAFSNVTAAPASERKTVAGTVRRYVRFEGNVTGSGTITVAAGFYRG